MKLSSGTDYTTTTACIDSGCVTSVISTYVLNRIGNVTVNNSDVQLLGVDGNPFNVDGVTNLDVDLDSKFKVHKVKFLVTKRNIPTLLGMNVIGQFYNFQMSHGGPLVIQPSQSLPSFKMNLVKPEQAFKSNTVSNDTTATLTNTNAHPSNGPSTMKVKPSMLEMAKPKPDEPTSVKLQWLRDVKGVHINYSNQKEVDDIACLLFELSDSIGSEREPLGTFPEMVDIKTTENAATAIMTNHVPEALERQVDEEIQNMLKNGIIERCDDPQGWNSPVYAVRKANGKVRVVANFKHTLNQKLVQMDPYPTPDVTKLFTKMGKGNKYFACMDLKSGYWQMKLSPESRPLTAFQWRGVTYVYIRLPFGLTHSGSLFSRRIFQVIEVLSCDGIATYIDDNCIYAKTFEQFKSRLRKFLQQLIKYNLKLNPSKCTFISSSAKFLGRIVDENGTHADPSYTDALLKMPAPTNRKELLSLLGKITWLKSYLETQIGEKIATNCFSALMATMTSLSSPKVKFQWTKQASQQFEKVKKKLTSSPVVSFPDFSKPFMVICDASNIACGAVLVQCNSNGGQSIVAACSHKFSHTESRWSTIEREAFGLLFACRKFNYFLEARHFTIRCDHKPLIHLDRKIYNNAKLRRWQEELSRYHFTVVHIKGEDNGIADWLSRPCGVTKIGSATDDSGPVGQVYQVGDGPFQIYIPSWVTKEFKSDEIKLKPISKTVAMVLSAKLSGDEETRKTLSHSFKQNDDSVIAKMKQFLTDKRNGVDNGELENALNGPDEEPYKRYAKDISLGHGTDSLYVWRNGTPYVIVPRSLISSYLFQAHDQLGHCGHTRMREYLKHFYWPNKAQDIIDYVNSCMICARRKGNYGHHSKPHIGHCNRGQRPFSHLVIDFVGPLECSNGKKYICTILCSFTRFFAAYATRADGAIDASKSLVDFITRHRVTPVSIGSDRGSHFVGATFQNTLKSFGIRHAMHVAWRPQSTGNLERCHRVLKNSIFAVCAQTNAKWSTVLDHVVSNMNATCNTTTKCSPHYAVYGRHPTLFMPTPPSEIHATTAVSYGMAISRQLETIHKLVSVASNEADIALEEKYNTGKHAEPLNPGDKVLLYRPHSVEAKRTKMPWLEGYTVVKSNGLVIMIKNRDGQTDWVHRHHVRLIQERPEELDCTLNSELLLPTQSSILVPQVSHQSREPPKTSPQAPMTSQTRQSSSLPRQSLTDPSSGGDGNNTVSVNERPVRDKRRPIRLIETMDAHKKVYKVDVTSEAKQDDTEDIFEMIAWLDMMNDTCSDTKITSNAKASVTDDGCRVDEQTFETDKSVSSITEDIESSSTDIEYEADSLDTETSDIVEDGIIVEEVEIESLHSSDFTKSTSTNTDIAEQFADILEAESLSPESPPPVSHAMTCPDAPHKKKTENPNEWVQVPKKILRVPLEDILTIEQMTEIRNESVFFKIKSLKELSCSELQCLQCHYTINRAPKWKPDDKLSFVTAKRKYADKIINEETSIKIHGLDKTTQKIYPVISVPYKYTAASENIDGMEIRALDWFQLMTFCIKNKIELQKDDLTSRDTIINVIVKSVML